MPGLLDGINAALKHLGARQQVIASNIANADTPGYKAQTLANPDFAALVDSESKAGLVSRPAVQPTAAMAAMGAKSGERTILDRSVTETKPDGNNISLEDQLLGMGEVQADYATLTSIYRKQIDLLRTALGNRNA